MIRPETWVVIAADIKSAWGALGPLAGVFIGAILSRSWDRRKWMNDNRKEECRELLTAITKTADAYVADYEMGDGFAGNTLDYYSESYLEFRKSLVAIQDRIFISKELSEHKMFALWGDTIGDFIKTEDKEQFAKRLKLLKAMIMEIAMAK